MWIYLLVACKVWENKRHGARKGHGTGKKAWRWKKRAWRWEKRAWRGAMLKGAGGNTIYLSIYLTGETNRPKDYLSFVVHLLSDFPLIPDYLLGFL